ncbi:hypothetical protein [Rhizobium sp. AN80A]|uniref:hypothetical protein n=1 Tax=Rhizobium sp. AN80A TaxID=3040673 RepID=UPI0024B3C07B|nr:hypothetical protein [Rhizobium sp. AN80A]
MPVTWEELEIGTQTGRTTLAVSDAMLDEYLDIMQLDHKLFEATPGQARLLPSDMLGKLGMDDLFQNFLMHEVGPNMRAKQSFVFSGAVHANQTLTATGYVVEKYEKRGKNFVTLEAVFRDDKGNALLTDRRTQLMLAEKAAAAE